MCILSVERLEREGVKELVICPGEHIVLSAALLPLLALLALP